MDGLVGPITHADHVFRVQQCVRVLEHVLFRQRIQMVNNNARPNGFAVSYHPVGDLVVFARKVTPSIPHNDPVPELPPLSDSAIGQSQRYRIQPYRAAANNGNGLQRSHTDKAQSMSSWAYA